MTETEIIEYLKGNKEKGVAFAFMPMEVKHWCGFHSPDKIFKVFDGVWLDSCCVDCFSAKHVYCLSDDYEPKPEFKPHYEEFDVYGNGLFRILKESEPIYYHWFNWQKFIEENFDNYNNFGGWLFKDIIWCTNPHLTTNFDAGDGGLTDYVSKDEECEPVMPTKIRFWRHKE